MTSDLRCVYVGYDEIGKACMTAGDRLGVTAAGLVTYPWVDAGNLAGGCDLASWADRRDVPVHETIDANGDACIDWLRKVEPDIVLVTGWSRLLKNDFIAVPTIGVFGMHPTLLPKHRGRAPIPWAILSGLTETGVTLFRILDPSADAGPIVGQVRVAIEPRETATTLYQKMLDAHVRVLNENFVRLGSEDTTMTPQDPLRVSSWPRRRPDDGIIDWDSDASYIDAWIRAQTRPYPGAFTYADSRKVTIWEAQETSREWRLSAGTVAEATSDGIIVACGRRSLLIQEAQLDDGQALRDEQLAAAVPVNTVLG